MSLDAAMNRLGDALTRLEQKFAARLNNMESELSEVRAERDRLGRRSAELEAQYERARSTDSSTLEIELKAMSTAHDALLRRYGELERRFFALQAAASQALRRIDGVIAHAESGAFDDVQSSYEEGRPEVQIRVNRSRAGDLCRRSTACIHQRTQTASDRRW